MPGFHAIIHGRVQGVGYRYFVCEVAQSMKISGWVRNQWNGTVEILASGERDQLEKFLEILREGPPLAFVQRIDIQWNEEEINGEFQIRR